MAPTVTVQPQALPPTFSDAERETLRQYAIDTWQSIAAMTGANGLPADHMDAGGARAVYTSPTNIGSYMWSAIAARDLQIISSREAHQRIDQSLAMLSKIERHSPSGMYYNWYSTETGGLLTTWPAGGGPVYPFLSTVDNGWLAAALIVVSNSMPELRAQVLALLEAMNFGFFEEKRSGQLRGGYWPFPCPHRNENGFTCFNFGTLNTEPRIASYIGIAMGQLPASHYFRIWRTLPESCDWSWSETQPAAVTHTYLGVDVFEGCYTYAGMNIVPSWGGSMFEALMVPLFVPEVRWGPASWGVNHPLYVQAHIYHGMHQAQYGYWGFSPANNPSGGYRTYGVDAIGMQRDGYPSNNDCKLIKSGFRSRRKKARNTPLPGAFNNGVVTPHASFLALEVAPREALQNLANLRQDFDIYSQWGFWDSVNVATGQVSRYALALDQGMVMAALANALCGSSMQEHFSQGMIQQAIQPLLALETFTAGPASPPVSISLPAARPENFPAARL